MLADLARLEDGAPGMGRAVRGSAADPSSNRSPALPALRCVAAHLQRRAAELRHEILIRKGLEVICEQRGSVPFAGVTPHEFARKVQGDGWMCPLGGSPPPLTAVDGVLAEGLLQLRGEPEAFEPGRHVPDAPL